MKKIPLHSLVIMVGPSGGGKSTLAKAHFPEYEIISADNIKEELVGDITRHDVNKEVFREVYHRTNLKLSMGERVVIDAPNIRTRDRVNIARQGEAAGVSVFYIVCNRTMDEKNNSTFWRQSIPNFVEDQEKYFTNDETNILQGDGLAEVIDTRIVDFEAVQKLPIGDLLAEIKNRGYNGITVVSDIHGMRFALKSAIQWGYARNHFIIFLGDIIDYGPKSLECIDDVYDVITSGNGALVYGNHERKIDRWLQQDKIGKIRLNLSDGNLVTIGAIKNLTPTQRHKFEIKYNGLMKISRNHFVVDNLLFTHAAGHPDMFTNKEYKLKDHQLSSLAMFGEIDNNAAPREDGQPNRIYEWVNIIPAEKTVIVGHDIKSTEAPVRIEGDLGGMAIFLDTGSGKGGYLTTADIRFDGGTLLKVENFNRH